MSKIEWTHRPGTKSEVWNPTTGCDKVSAGCRNCYAEVMHKRLRGMGQKKYQHPFLGYFTMHEDELMKPFTWRKPRTVFVNSMSDLFHSDVTWDFLDKVFTTMVLTPWHTYQILTKRSDELAKYFAQGKEALVKRWEEYEISFGEPKDPACSVYNLCHEWPRPNIWIGVSAENQETLDERIPHLLTVPAAVRFVSYEPALGPIDISSWLYPKEFIGMPVESYDGKWWDTLENDIHWIIAGGESGNKARPAHPDWFRSVRDQCKAADVKFFFKQHGAWEPINIHRIDQPMSKVGYFNEQQKFVECKNWKYLPSNFGRLPGDKRVPMTMVGKAKSGNMLDSVQHLEFPG